MPRVGRLAGLAGIALVLALLAGCSSLPDSVNPGKWAEGAGDWVGGLFSDSSDDEDAVPEPKPIDQAADQSNQSAAQGTETPKLGNDVRPAGEPTAERQQIADSLVADRQNAQYTQAEQEREGAPTRPLEPDQSLAPASMPTQAADTSSSPPPAPTKKQLTASGSDTSAPAAPSADTAPLPVPTAPATQSQQAPPNPAEDTDSVVAPSARVAITDYSSKSSGQSASSATASNSAPAPAAATIQMAAVTPPPPPPKPQTVSTTTVQPQPQPQPQPALRPAAAPLSAKPLPLDQAVTDVYRQRLAEFNNADRGAATGASYAPAPAPAQGAMNDDTFPSATKVTAAHGTGGAHPLSALNTAGAAARFELAQITFSEGTASTAIPDDAQIQAVAELYRASHGAMKIGIVGHSDSTRLDVNLAANEDANRSLASERAAAIARALERQGVPAAAIYAGATGETAGDYVEVFGIY